MRHGPSVYNRIPRGHKEMQPPQRSIKVNEKDRRLTVYAIHTHNKLLLFD